MNFWFIDRRKFEKLFWMNSWYVLNFSNRTFWDFIIDSIWINVYERDYESKANLLRKLWNNETNYNIWKLLLDFLSYMKDENLVSQDEEYLFSSCLKVATDLKNDTKIKDINIQNLESSKTIDLLLKEIKDGVSKENPEVILDRLHTLSTRFIRSLCQKHNIDTIWKSLSSLFWSFAKKLINDWIIESGISEKIFKSNIQILEEFNNIRNNNSLAHDNPILNSLESSFIINNVINLLEFIDNIENSKKIKIPTIKEEINIEDIPF